MPEYDGDDAQIAALFDEAQRITRKLRTYKRKVLRNYLIPMAMIVGFFIQIFTVACYDCEIDRFWWYFSAGYWLALPFVVYFFLRTRLRLGFTIYRANKQRKQIIAEIKRLSESPPEGQT